MHVRDCRLVRRVLTEVDEELTYDPLPTWALFGSAVLELHGLREEIADVDIAVSHGMFERLAGRLATALRVPYPFHPPYLEMRDGGGCVHIFYDWRHDEPLIDLREVRRESSVHGESVAEQWPATSLRVVRGHKIACEIYHGTQGRWSKHSDDLAKLNEHLGVTP
jgi:hypothetical protein